MLMCFKSWVNTVTFLMLSWKRNVSGSFPRCILSQNSSSSYKHRHSTHTALHITQAIITRFISCTHTHARTIIAFPVLHFYWPWDWFNSSIHVNTTYFIICTSLSFLAFYRWISLITAGIPLLQFPWKTKVYLFRSSYHDWLEAAAHFHDLLITKHFAFCTFFCSF